MADNLTRLSSVPSRLLEDNSGLKVTPRRGLTEVRNTPSQGPPTADNKNTRSFGGQTHTQTPTCLQRKFSAKKKTSVTATHTLTIWEDPAVKEAEPESVEKEYEADSEEEEEEIDTCDRVETRDEESILDGLDMRDTIVLLEEDKLLNVIDDDAKTIIFGCEEDNLSIYTISSESEWSGDERVEEEEEGDGVSKYFYSPYGVATNFEDQWECLIVSSHESDTEIDTCDREETRDEEWILDGLDMRDTTVLVEDTTLDGTRALAV